MRTLVSCLGAALVCVVIIPGTAVAQSAIAGIVKDASGAVLPGVTVEAASPALIEKTRSVVSDAQGNYKIVDLRPGVYAVTFSLAGFSSVKREGLELPSNFTMSVNADLRVGSLQETVVVTGESPVVDVQTNTRASVLSRDILDTVPNSHTIQSVGQLVVGVTLTAPDVGGSQAMQQTYFSVHGAGAAHRVVSVDRDAAGGWPVQAGDQPQEHGLARAVGAGDAKRGARGNGERNILQDDTSAKTADDVLDDHGRFSRRPRNRRPVVVFDGVQDCHMGTPSTPQWGPFGRGC